MIIAQYNTEMNNSNDLVEYFAQIMPQARVECAGCGVEREISKAVTRGDLIYCSESCADRACAVMIKPQPKGVKLDGIDI